MSAIIASEAEETMDGQDSWTMRKMVMGIRDKLGLMGLYGVVVQWSFVVTTVFYCDCRKRHVNRSESDHEMVTV